MYDYRNNWSLLVFIAVASGVNDQRDVIKCLIYKLAAQTGFCTENGDGVRSISAGLYMELKGWDRVRTKENKISACVREKFVLFIPLENVRCQARNIIFFSPTFYVTDWVNTMTKNSKLVKTYHYLLYRSKEDFEQEKTLGRDKKQSCFLPISCKI